MLDIVYIIMVYMCYDIRIFWKECFIFKVVGFEV